jgi:hypothetical protein
VRVVTGAFSFTGSYVARALVRSGEPVGRFRAGAGLIAIELGEEKSTRDAWAALVVLKSGLLAAAVVLLVYVSWRLCRSGCLPTCPARPTSRQSRLAFAGSLSA